MSTVRLTKSDIERKLLTGEFVAWKDANGRDSQFALSDPTKRRLFAFLLKTKVREPTGLSQEFIDGLSSAYDGTDDPASAITSATAVAPSAGPWRLQSIVTEGFGGLNVWGGPPFEYNFDQENLLIEGPNGSGKSSLIGAILWALAGERPRDQSDSYAHEPKPVFGSDDKPAGNWPPIACYPLSAADLKVPSHVSVKLVFQDPEAKVAKVERSLNGSKVTTITEPAGFEVPSILLETGILMPARLAQIRFNEGGGRLTDAVQKLTGLDELITIGVLTVGLCHKSREYLSYKRKDLTQAMKEFNEAIAEAHDELTAVKVSVPTFTVAHVDDEKTRWQVSAKCLTIKQPPLLRSWQVILLVVWTLQTRLYSIRLFLLLALHKKTCT
jgi:ATPase involved in DNA repair